MEILTAYIRKNFPTKNDIVVDNEEARDRKSIIDTQATLNVLERKNQKHEGKEFWVFDLSGTYLAGANLEGANLGGANVEGANLKEAHLEGTSLKEAYLAEVHLEGRILEGLTLRG